MYDLSGRIWLKWIWGYPHDLGKLRMSILTPKIPQPQHFANGSEPTHALCSLRSEKRSKSGCRLWVQTFNQPNSTYLLKTWLLIKLLRKFCMFMVFPLTKSMKFAISPTHIDGRWLQLSEAWSSTTPPAVRKVVFGKSENLVIFRSKSSI